jgi:hypothetical protein
MATSYAQPKSYSAGTSIEPALGDVTRTRRAILPLEFLDTIEPVSPIFAREARHRSSGGLDGVGGSGKLKLSTWLDVIQNEDILRLV